jgi:hypothetical protein
LRSAHQRGTFGGVHLFSKPINSITLDDVKALVALELTESTRHDYKADFPPENYKLAATIASMANTMGGVTLIGVEQPVGSKPSIVGVAGAADKLKERAGQILLQHIHPTPLYEIGVVEIPAGEAGAGKFVVVVRAHESRSAPHAMVEDSAIYTRTGDLKTPHKYADLRWLEHLLQRRAEPEQQWRRLVAEFESQFHSRADKVVAPGGPARPRILSAFGRTYPHEMLTSGEGTAEVLRTCFLEDRVVAAPGGAYREFAHEGQFEFIRAHAVGLFLRGLTTRPGEALTFEMLKRFVAASYARSAVALSRQGWQGSVRWDVKIERRAGVVLGEIRGGAALGDVADARAEMLAGEAFEPSGTERAWGVLERIAWGMGKEAPPQPKEWHNAVLSARA